MAKKFGKLMLFSAVTGAAAAGTYYLLQKKNDTPVKDADEIDDFDDFDEDLDEDFDEQPSSNKNRSYVSLDLENAKEIIGEKVIETLDKTKEKLVEFNVPEKLDKAKEFVEGYTHASESQKAHTASNVSQTYTTVPTPQPQETPTQEASAYQDEDKKVETEEFFDDTEE